MQSFFIKDFYRLNELLLIKCIILTLSVLWTIIVWWFTASITSYYIHIYEYSKTPEIKTISIQILVTDWFSSESIYIYRERETVCSGSSPEMKTLMWSFPHSSSHLYLISLFSSSAPQYWVTGSLMIIGTSQINRFWLMFVDKNMIKWADGMTAGLKVHGKEELNSTKLMWRNEGRWKTLKLTEETTHQ